MKKAALLLIGTLFALRSVFPSPALAQNPVCLFWGNATVDGALVPPGTRVSAWVEGAEVAEAAWASDGSYVIKIVEPEGTDFKGKTVSFTIGELPAAQTGTWAAGEVYNINLEQASVASTPTPTAAKSLSEQGGGSSLSAPIAIGAAAVAGFLTWFFVWKRRRK